jgi:hypothetical protein
MSEKNSKSSLKDQLAKLNAKTLNNHAKLSFGEAKDESLEELLKKSESNEVVSGITKALSRAQSANAKAPSLAFTESPNSTANYEGLYKYRKGLLPPSVIKQIRVQDHLIAAILRTRGAQASLFGHLREDRFDRGLELKIKPEFYKILTPEQNEKILERMKRAESLLLNCGHNEGLEDHEKMSLADFLDQSTRNGYSFGQFATEIIYDRSEPADIEGNYPFSRFRPRDAGTIFRAVRKGDNLDTALREEAIKLLAELTGDKTSIKLEALQGDEYAWVQSIDHQPRSAFTHKEMLVCNLFPSTDVEHNGYPVTPLDTIVNSVTTHIAIDTYKKLFFQNGRASKGAFIIKADSLDQPAMEAIKREFDASINNVSNSFRTPLLGLAPNEDATWVSFQNEGLSDGFEYMYDQIARNILSAFSMSPDELPSYGHLSKATNSQSLSESSNEYKLTAARDTGLRPMIQKLETFFNQRLFPIIDPILSKICEIKFAGLDAQSVEQESTRLQQNMSISMCYDDVMDETDKEMIGEAFGGKMPFSERLQLVLDKYVDVGDIKARFFDSPAAAVDPALRYKRDPFALQQLQLLSQISPATVQALYAPRPYAIDMLKMQIEDMLEEDSEE